MEIKRYMDIERLKDKYRDAFTIGEHITITEKIDGANASIRYDEKSDSLIGFSRNRQVNKENNLQGFYDYVQTVDKDSFKSVLGIRYIVFGEWLVKHTVKYPDDTYRKFYAFDVWDTEKEQYLPHEEVTEIANKLDFERVPLLYNGKFTGWDDAEKYVGITKLNAAPCGEGIVIKSQNRLDNKFSGTPAYVKIVSEQFSEAHDHKVKKSNVEKSEENQENLHLSETIVTKRRVEKLLQKFVEWGKLPEGYDEHHLKTIAKILPKACYEDCMKEEPETVARINDFSKILPKLCMRYARQIIFER